ncbi:hypothetical protein ALQ78_100986 [Pseudomonas syringae pv. aptata]|nr:hypothetical protein ALQ78_100986 [Pseudomonas syringae pv. aptata]
MPCLRVLALPLNTLAACGQALSQILILRAIPISYRRFEPVA